MTTTDDLPSEESVTSATGKGWDAWFAILDGWGARERTHPEIAVYLADAQGVQAWWTQAITVAYERSRGMRLKHQQADGFTIYASKTIGVPAEVLYDAFVEPRRRKLWLTDGTMTKRTGRPYVSARFDWEDGATRVNVSFDGKGPGRTTVAIEHQRLPDPDAAETAKALWRKRLGVLKSVLES